MIKYTAKVMKAYLCLVRLEVWYVGTAECRLDNAHRLQLYFAIDIYDSCETLPCVGNEQ